MVEVLGEEKADATVVTVSDNDPGIPSNELAVLEAGEETPLKHGTGVGVWVIQQAIDESNATIEFEASNDGTSVTVQIPTRGD